MEASRCRCRPRPLPSRAPRARRPPSRASRARPADERASSARERDREELAAAVEERLHGHRRGGSPSATRRSVASSRLPSAKPRTTGNGDWSRCGPVLRSSLPRCVPHGPIRTARFPRNIVGLPVSARARRAADGRRCTRMSTVLSSETTAARRAGRRRQRLLPPGRHGQRLGLPDGQQRPPPVDLPDGRPRLGEEPLPVEHPGAPDLVHDPREPPRLHRAQARARRPRPDEPGDRGGGRPRGRARARPSSTRRSSAVEKLRDDLRLYPVPFSELATKLPLPPEQAKLRRLLVNMIYVGVLSDLHGDRPRRDRGARSAGSSAGRRRRST